MKSFKLSAAKREKGVGFQIHRLGLHEKMPAGMVDRPEGTGDYLFMLFHSEVWVKSRDGLAFWSTPSFMAWTPSNSHYYGNANGSWNHSWFHCSGKDVGSVLKACRLPVRKRIEVTDPSSMKHFLLEVIAELSGWSRPDAKIIHNLFDNLVRALVRHAFHKTKQFAPSRLLAVRAYMEQHFDERLQLKDLAKQTGWSEPHLCTEFRRFFGIPVIQFVLQLRMNQALYLLRDHNRRVGEIASIVGYSDLYTFSKMFKRYMGVSPRTYRELNSRQVRSSLRGPPES